MKLSFLLFLCHRRRRSSNFLDRLDVVRVDEGPTVLHHGNSNNDDDDDDTTTTTSKDTAVALSEDRSRRQLILASMAGLNAEAAWRQAVATAAAVAADDNNIRSNNILPPGTIEQLQAGRAVVIPNWLSAAEAAVLRDDCQACFEQGEFSNFVYSKDNAGKQDHDPWFMPSFYPRRAADQGDGPFANPQVGNFAARQQIKAKMAQVKASLAHELQDLRPTLANDVKQTHEMEYIRYGAGGFLKRHTDERHLELKRPNASRLPLKPNASRRSITWLVYLNNDWEAARDGGQLRVYERLHAATVPVGARGRDLQIGWLQAVDGSRGEEPVFLDPLRPAQEGADITDKESCILYTCDSTGQKRYLSRKPFANIALYLGGGDDMARKLMIDNPDDAKRFHLIDAPKSAVSAMLASSSATLTANDGEGYRDIAPATGTLVMFDSVSLPHQVLQTNRERFGVQGWFHEKLTNAVSS